MKVRLPVRAAMGKYLNKEGEYVFLKATCKKDNDALRNLFSKKIEREKQNGREFFLTVLLDLPYQRRTFKQNSSVWKLITVIFESMDGRLPTEEEKYRLYLDLLEVYADRIPNRLNGQTRPVHISEANSLEGSRFIDALLQHLVSECDLSTDLQATVQEVLQEWEAWRGGLEWDHADYADEEGTRMISEEEWRKTHIYSDASGRGGVIERAHIVSRGAAPAKIEEAWNWLALTPEEHRNQHQVGWDEFLQIYPHLRGRVERARKLAGKLELEFKTAQKAIEYKGESLALQALERL